MEISVIVPVYNVENYVAFCIESIIKQSFFDFELILIDDGSTDRSGAICDEYREKDSRIRVIHKKNGGLSDARNTGLDLTRGNWILFVDSDDSIHPEMLRILFREVKQKKADIAICQYEEIYNKKNINVNNSIIKGKISTYSNVEALEMLYGNHAKYFVISCNKLMNKKLWESRRFPLGKIHEDEFMIAKLLYDAKRVVYIENKLYYYLQRSNSIMYTLNKKSYFDALGAFQKRMIFFRKIRKKQLYINAWLNYMGYMVMVYQKLEENILNESEKKFLLQNFRNEIKKCGFQLFYWKTKIHMLVFFISPKLYELMCKILKNIKRQNIIKRGHSYERKK